MSLIDRVTEIGLSLVTPDVVEFGTRFWRRMRGQVANGRWTLTELNAVPALNLIDWQSPDAARVIPDAVAFGRALQLLMAPRRVAGSYIAALVPDQAFHVGVLSALPLRNNPLAVLEREIQSSASKPLKEYQYTYEIGPQRGAKSNALFCAMLRYVIEAFLDQLDVHDLIPLSIEPSFVALASIFRSVDGEASPHPAVWVHIGHRHTCVGVLLSGGVRRMQMLPVGGANLVSALMTGLNLTAERAEAMLGTEEILLAEPTSDAQQQIPAYQAIEPILADMLNRIYGVLQQHAAEFPQEGAFRRMLLCGGGCAPRNLETLVAANLGLPVVRLGSLLNVVAPGGRTLAAPGMVGLEPALGALLQKPWRHDRQDRLVA